MTRPRRTLEFLDSAQVDRIIEGACRVLGTTGVLVDNGEASLLLLEAGAARNGGRILIPEELVRTALSTVPHEILLWDRDGAASIVLGGTDVHFDPGSAAIYILDGTTRARRKATRSDVIALTRLVDRLPNYDVQSTALVPGDVPAEIADRYRLYIALMHGRKPIVTGTFRKDGFAPMHAMLTAVRGSEEALAKKPLAVFDCCVSPPLKWSDLTCQALLDCARSGIPAEIIPMPMTGATSPITLEQTLVQHCAENLSGIVIHQMAGPGAPIIFGGAPAAFDMRHGTTTMGAMETTMLVAAYAQIGRHLGLPTHGYLCVSDAKSNDYQSGLESGIGAVSGALAGVNMISGAGMLDFLLTQSLEKILLDHDACGMALRAARGIEADGGDAAAAIAEGIANGEFLSLVQTRSKWQQELSLPSDAIDRGSHADWHAAGGKRAEQRANAEVERILREHVVPPLPRAIAAALDEVIEREMAAR